MNLKKSLMIISLLLCILISLSAVSANEDMDLISANSAQDDSLSTGTISEDSALSEGISEDISVSEEISEDEVSTPEPAVSEDIKAEEESVDNDGSMVEDAEVSEVANDIAAIPIEDNGGNADCEDNQAIENIKGSKNALKSDGEFEEYYDVFTTLKISSIKVYKGKYFTLKAYVNGLSDSVGTVYISTPGGEYSAKVYNGVATFKIRTDSSPGKYSFTGEFSGGSLDNTYYYSSKCSFTITVAAKAKISVANYKSYYNSGKKFTVKVMNPLNNKPHANVDIKIILYKKGKKVYSKTVTTNSKGIYKGNITKGVGTYKMVVKMAEKGYTYKSASASVKVVKSKVKLKAYKDSYWQGYKNLLFVSVKDRKGKLISTGKVKFRINGKTYTAKVKNGYAYKLVKLPKAGVYKYSAKYISKNYYTKKAKSKVTVKRTYKTKILVSDVVGYQDGHKTVHVYIRTKSGKKVPGGYISVSINGQTKYYDVNKKGHAKFILHYGNNYRGYSYVTDYRGYRYYTYYYGKKATFRFPIRYYSSTLKYKNSKTSFKLTRKYRCAYCGSKESHYHGGYNHFIVN